MTRVSGPTNKNVQQRLIAEADQRGNADGVADPCELKDLAHAMEANVAPAFDDTYVQRLEAVRELSANPLGLPALDGALRKLPESLRRLALELDALWGNADGKVSVNEVDRVARYYLAALPFFTKNAADLLELARYLRLDGPVPDRPPLGVLQLRTALATVDSARVGMNQPFRTLFDEAVRVSESPGAPELLRDAAMHSPRWHKLGILEHSSVAVRAGIDLSRAVQLDWRDAGATMLLHDIGKMLEREVEHQAGVRAFAFTDHESMGAQWLKARGVSDELAFQVQHHRDLRALTVEQMIELSGGNNERLARMVVVYVADQVAKGDTPDQMASFTRETPKILALAEHAGIDGQALLLTAHNLWEELFPEPDAP
jgi:putative nucleotidyltransferase with HDIG domain